MNEIKYCNSPMVPAYVLKHDTPDDVARAMIERGEQMQPFYIFNMDEAYRRVQHFREMMPRIKIFYAVKSNHTEEMLRLAVALGIGFDCASPGEIYKMRKLGVHPRSIIYAMPCKSPKEMIYAQRMGVQHTTFDSSCELEKILESWPEAKLLIRIRIDGLSKIKLGLKYGCDFETEAFDLLDQAARLGLSVIGVAFHVGSLCFSPESYVLGLQQARALFDHEARNGRKMCIVDIGGGFLSHNTDSIDEVSSLINHTIKELFPDPRVQVIAEPGGYLCDSAFKMYCRVVGVRKVIRNNTPVNMIYLNNGIYGSLRFDETWHKVYKFQRSTEKEPIVEEETVLWGPTCNNLDQVGSNKHRLPRCGPGDWLVIDAHGAYTISFTTSFSSMEVPLVRPVVSKQLWNSIKNSSVFRPSDFVLNYDISAPLPSTLPPILPADEIYEHLENLLLKCVL